MQSVPANPKIKKIFQNFPFFVGIRVLKFKAKYGDF